MPKSKREKKVALTQTDAKGTDHKQKIVTDIREACEEYERVFVISFENFRTAFMKDLRKAWQDSRFFQSKNKVMAVAFGRSEDDQYMENMAEIGQLLMRSGEKGVLFTNRPREEVEEFLKSFKMDDFARGGTIATKTVPLEVGPLEGIQGTMEPMLRKLGLPTTLRNGVIHIDREYNLCTEGEELTAEQCKVLKLFEIKMVEFHLQPLGMWDKTLEMFFEL